MSDNERKLSAHRAMEDFILTTSDADARQIANAELQELYLDGCVSDILPTLRIVHILDKWAS